MEPRELVLPSSGYRERSDSMAEEISAMPGSTASSRVS